MQGRGRLAAVCLGIFFLSSQAFAWGNRGHQIVALLAYRHLTTAARANVDATLKLGNPSTIDGIATLPDDWREARPETKEWHFADIPKTASAFSAARDCKHDECVVAQIGHFEQVLQAGTASSTERFEALAFVVHFLGDLHQPLHCADDHDRGGNTVKVRFLGTPANLHQVWDSRLISRADIPENADYVAHLENDVLGDDDPAERAKGTPTDWANQAHVQATTHSYVIPAGGALDAKYADDNLLVVDEQLLRAGLRLAAELNRVFGSSAKSASAAGASCSGASESRAEGSARPANQCYRGNCPCLSSAWRSGTTISVARSAYALEESTATKIPVWVAEHIVAKEIEGSAERGGFAPDPLLADVPRAELADYRGSGYDRGHQAPAGNHKASQDRMDETFYLSNMAPQNPEFNRQLWRDIEERSRAWVAKRGEAYEVTGPIFWNGKDPADPKPSFDTIGKNAVAVPTHFYKILVAPKPGGGYEAIAFVAENRAYKRPFQFQQLIRSVAWVEAHTGVTFFPTLAPDERKALVETTASLWK